jgi:hypothetical protein
MRKGAKEPWKLPDDCYRAGRYTEAIDFSKSTYGLIRMIQRDIMDSEWHMADQGALQRRSIHS